MPGDFYFMKDKFYSDFANCGLMPNKENTNQNTGNRPCFFAFKDKNEKNIYWLIPISSKFEKYKNIYDKNVERYGRCDFIDFGTVLGTNAAFLIQNMFPTTKDYIDSRYVVNGVVVKTDNVTTDRIIHKAEDVLEKSKRGIKLTFTDIKKIYETLVRQNQDKKNTTQKKTEKILIEPLRIYKKTDKAVMVKLPGASAGEKKAVWLPNEGIMLDKERAKVIGIREDLQQKYSLKLPQGQPKRFLK